MAGRGKYILAGFLVVSAVAYLVVSGTGNAAHYFLTIEELQAMGDEAVGRNITISGAVLGDTIRYDASVPCLTFTIAQVPADPLEVEQAGGLAAVLHAAVNDTLAPRLEVVYQDVKPDLLEDEAQAIIRGQLGDDGRFHADELLLKCPARYEEEVPGQAGEP